MRDLANRDFSKRRFSFDFNFTLRLIVLALIVFSGLALVKTVFLSGRGAGGSSVILSEAPRGLKPIQAEQVNITAEGVDLATQKTSLVDVKYGGQAKGTATRSYGGGSYILTVEVTLPDTKGASWEVWLADSEGALREVDFLTCTTNSCSLNLRGPDKFSNFNEIWVTRELTREDNKPEQHVLEGSW
ncbi:hypothetical protein HYS90_00520 [Candidatus Curtissbacteria bacterium]|nr:hypothetical protein [Candidatus Curtissbacteria bacterium]